MVCTDLLKLFAAKGYENSEKFAHMFFSVKAAKTNRALPVPIRGKK
ncbi:MAG: hypothetical protein LBG21_01655 [Campylobacteraceae bacterium]|nr:hypothetical protein [Campylobacteraceae bacterium]